MTSAPAAPRKIVHVDMDAFYASVEQRDRPELRGRPVVVAWSPEPRSVVCAASYEARRFGVRSAMPATRAARLCPDAVWLRPDFPRYKAVSREVHAIFRRHTDLVEPLSLDEAYLDVTVERTGLPSATATAQAIRAAIRAELGLTASAGVASNKLLAKIASDWRKPDGLFVIRPREAAAFLAPLPVGRLPGVGRATERILAELGLATAGDLRQADPRRLERRLGRFGPRLVEYAWGRDERPVQPDRPARSLSAESTFPEDLAAPALGPELARLAALAWARAERHRRIARTVTLKLRTAAFRTHTRSQTPERPPAAAAEVAALAVRLLATSGLPPETRFRLAGVALSGFADEAGDDRQRRLF
ncbi:MAG: DNA polymerase IV [Acidobacteria bacterium]|nr:DNA polymerase IV [Thermoanaerobaculia bacterium]MDI9630884.1 DNA polymerase IV [Acidobacteriota bacterium]OQC38336.1 MAG: DNA polymerase IV [Acidobacteria bacterium ADurb.Bin051]MBP7813930.1 DNA polymerase IV [Thermoanaerobaculia bacterium]MBP8845209.1 DNA polymerase IV [Thermoanaerobaculia bacterium]